MVLQGDNIVEEGELYFGLYVGEVVNVDDEEDWGRIQVRVHEIYGEENETPEEDLPWAYEIQVYGGCFDSGSRTPFLKGSTVVVMFEAGNPLHPMVMGGLSKRPDLGWKYYGPYSNTNPTWSPPDEETEIPKEAVGEGNTVFVPFKTPKGTAIIIEEKDGSEFIRIIDRAGQIIEMRSPVKPKAGGVPRGTKNKIDSDGLDYEDMLPPSTIRIVDLAGQEILLHSEPGKEMVSITSQDREGTKKQSLILDNTKGQENIILRDYKGQYYKLSAFESKVIMESLGDYQETTALNKIENIGASHTKQVGTSMAYQTGTDLTLNSGGIMNLSATGILTIQALATVVISAVGLLSLSSVAAITITAVGILSLLSSAIVIGVVGQAQTLCNRQMLLLYNSHTHQYVTPLHAGPPAPTDTPLPLGVEGTHTTVNLQGS